MSFVPLIFNGLDGSSEVHPHALIPSTGFVAKAESNRDPFKYQPYEVAPEMFNKSIDYSSRFVCFYPRWQNQVPYHYLVKSGKNTYTYGSSLGAPPPDPL